MTVFFPFGTRPREIFRRLEAEGVVVAPPWLAEAYYRVARSATPLQAGEYRFSRPTPLSVVIDRMGRGRRRSGTRSSVPEGLTADETFELFWSRGISRPEAFRNALRNPQLIASVARGAPDLEGFLFPDTYVVTRSTSARQIVETMLANFRQPLHAGPARPRRRPPGLTGARGGHARLDRPEGDLARPRGAAHRRRLLEPAAPRHAPSGRPDRGLRPEARRQVDRHALPLRLRLRVPLQHVPDRRPAARARSAIPALDALKAAADPARTDFLYFVADRTGGHTFSRTFEEHLEAIATARRQRAGRAAEPAEDAHARNSASPPRCA